MPTVYALLWLAGLLPLGAAWRANRATSLLHAVHWAFAAWAGWGAALVLADADLPDFEPARFVALCLTACAGTAVLGARRPYAVAWNFVVLGLLAVMLLPLAESLVIGTRPVDDLRVFFVGATLAVVALNYLPTRLAPAAFLLALVAVLEMAGLFAPSWLPGRGELPWVHALGLAVPWVAWASWRSRGEAGSEFDRLWLDFRDRFGLLWSQRAREQFNHAARSAGWGVTLYWQGLRRHRDAEVAKGDEDAIVGTLRAILKRFVDAKVTG